MDQTDWSGIGDVSSRLLYVFCAGVGVDVGGCGRLLARVGRSGWVRHIGW